ncbi:hypothetical protein [Arcticibacter sp.]|uniref:hypothetical protein n=1 Tax=Arcticibacter sp. TaxID=1872630 RepID=UPI003890C652
MPKIFLIITGFGLLFSSCSPHSRGLENAPADSFYSDEVKPVRERPCFEGAYYRKLVSSEDSWLGISGKVVLPKLQFDERRINPKKPKQYLDNPSIYLGGLMGGQETDIGLAWEIVKDDDGSISAERKAFRPFLRRTGHVSGQAAVFENAPAKKEYYWYPGEEVYMSVRVIANGKIRFIVEGAGKKFERDFECDGYTFDSKGEFKRVNAIDQVANEGKPVQSTGTKVFGSEWKSTSLYRSINKNIIEVPFHNGRYTEMTCPGRANFRVVATEEQRKRGAEILSISGKGF